MEKVEVAYTSANLSRIDKQLDEMEKKFDRIITIIDKMAEKITELRITKRGE